MKNEEADVRLPTWAYPVQHRCRGAVADTYIRDRTIVEEQAIQRDYATDVNISN